MKLRIITLAALLACSVSAFAVDVTLTLTAGQVTRALAALGKAKNYKTPDTPAVLDGQGNIVTPLVPGVPRVATAAELKTYVSDTLRILVQDQERQTAVKTATDAVSPPAAFDPT